MVSRSASLAGRTTISSGAPLMQFRKVAARRRQVVGRGLQRLDVAPRARDRRGPVQDRKTRAVEPGLAVQQLDQLAPLFGELPAEDVVGRRLDAEHVQPGLQALPLDQ